VFAKTFAGGPALQVPVVGELGEVARATVTLARATSTRRDQEWAGWLEAAVEAKVSTFAVAPHSSAFVLFSRNSQNLLASARK
jgi:hypothetical protein